MGNTHTARAGKLGCSSFNTMFSLPSPGYIYIGKNDLFKQNRFFLLIVKHTNKILRSIYTFFAALVVISDKMIDFWNNEKVS